MLVNRPSSFYTCLSVPEGIITLEENCGKHAGVMDPGLRCCYCSWKGIAAMITKNSIRFDAPIKGCPTKDNVLVTMDLGVTFHIGKDQDDPE
jgi:regulator of protease activity HflC (stomatin/prohibitin superfamily)